MNAQMPMGIMSLLPQGMPQMPQGLGAFSSPQLQPAMALGQQFAPRVMPNFGLAPQAPGPQPGMPQPGAQPGALAAVQASQNEALQRALARISANNPQAGYGGGPIPLRDRIGRPGDREYGPRNMRPWEQPLPSSGGKPPMTPAAGGQMRPGMQPGMRPRGS